MWIERLVFETSNASFLKPSGAVGGAGDPVVVAVVTPGVEVGPPVVAVVTPGAEVVLVGEVRDAPGT